MLKLKLPFTLNAQIAGLCILPFILTTCKKEEKKFLYGEGNGMLTFYATALNKGKLDFYLDSEYVGSIAYLRNGVQCGEGDFSLIRKKGKYPLTIKYQGGEYKSTAEFREDVCWKHVIQWQDYPDPSSPPCTSMNYWIRVNTSFYTCAPYTLGRETTLKNTDTSDIVVRLAIESKGNVWKCSEFTLQPGESHTDRTCDATGRYNLWSLHTKEFSTCGFPVKCP